MLYPTFEYDEPLFRPPSEAFSAIFQITLGCSWNKCAFCEMYTTKKFKLKKFDAIENEIKSFSDFGNNIKKVFLADGDVLVLSTDRLLRILRLIKDNFPGIRRISSYATPRNFLGKSISELKELADAGLNLVYIGIESGNNELLERINKGETFESTVTNITKAQDSGIKTSLMIITGLGGEKYYKQHAIDSARVINAIQPDFLSTLILSFPFGVEHFKKRFKGEFIQLDMKGLLKELYLFIENISETELKKQVVFRSDHASNYLAMKGFLPRNKQQFLKKIMFAIDKPEDSKLRKEWQRGVVGF